MEEAKKRLAVALDTSDWGEYRHWAETFGRKAGVLKVGLQAFVRWGPRAVETAAKTGADVFLDAKLHDIPNTVGGAVESARALGVSYVTVHAAGGRRVLEAAARAAGEDLTILAVTVLTHLGEDELRELGVTDEPSRLAVRLAARAFAAGCGGAVCSPFEVAELRKLDPAGGVKRVLVTPGVRPAPRRDQDAGVRSDDQRRTATPREAIRNGSDLLVVGRPITQAERPEASLEAILEEISRAL